MTRRTSSIYLWIALFLAILVGRLRDLSGTGAPLAGYAVFVALTTAAIWKISAVKIKASRYCSFPGALYRAQRYDY